MDLELVKKIVEELLKDVGFSASLSCTEYGQGVSVTIDAGEENALLIGFHGETLNSLQTIASLIFFRKTGSYTPLTIDVGGYRAERAEKIKQLTVNAADRARFLVKSVELSPMPATERRLVHLYAAELPGVKSESVGEGRERRVVISPAG